MPRFTETYRPKTSDPEHIWIKSDYSYKKGVIAAQYEIETTPHLTRVEIPTPLCLIPRESRNIVFDVTRLCDLSPLAEFNYAAESKVLLPVCSKGLLHEGLRSYVTGYCLLVEAVKKGSFEVDG